MDGATASMQRETRRPLRAFTLIEVVCVMIIMAALVAIAAPRYAASHERYQLELAGQRINAALDYAASYARRTSSTVKLSFNTVTHQVLGVGLPDPSRTQESYTLRLAEAPYEVTLSGVDLGGDAAIVFNGYGDPDTGGTIKLTTAGRLLVIDVSAETGKGVIR